MVSFPVRGISGITLAMTIVLEKEKQKMLDRTDFIEREIVILALVLVARWNACILRR